MTASASMSAAAAKAGGGRSAAKDSRGPPPSKADTLPPAEMPRMRRVASRHSGHGTDTTDSSSGSGVNGTETGSSGSGVNGTETGSSGSGGDAGGRDHGWRQQRLAGER